MGVKHGRINFSRGQTSRAAMFFFAIVFATLGCGGGQSSPTPSPMPTPTPATATWTQLSPTGAAPAPRHAAIAGYDPSSNRMIIFGGREDAGPSIFNDVWVLTNANGTGGTPEWIQLNPSGSSLPAPRWVHGGGYDPANNVLVIFGGALGSSSPCTNDAWVLTNANGIGGIPTWGQLNVSGVAPAPRANFEYIYAQNSNRFIVVSGNDCFIWPFQDAFVLTNANGRGGMPAWTHLAPSGMFPIPLGTPTHGDAIYDPVSDRLVIWGFSFGPNTLLTLTGAGGTRPASWITTTLASGPTSLPSEQNAIYDQSLNVAVMFGGTSSANGVSNETWALNNANGENGTSSWAQVVISGSIPPARNENTVVYDAANKRMIIFGGIVENFTSRADANDVWVLALP